MTPQEAEQKARARANLAVSRAEDAMQNNDYSNAAGFWRNAAALWRLAGDEERAKTADANAAKCEAAK